MQLASQRGGAAAQKAARNAQTNGLRAPLVPGRRPSTVCRSLQDSSELLAQLSGIDSSTLASAVAYAQDEALQGLISARAQVGAAVQPLADAAWEAATRELAQVADLAPSLAQQQEPHFGTHAALASVNALEQWVGQQVGGLASGTTIAAAAAGPLQISDLQTIAADVQSAVNTLQGAVAALASAPASSGTGALPGVPLAALGQSLTGLVTALQSPSLVGSDPAATLDTLLAAVSSALQPGEGGRDLSSLLASAAVPGSSSSHASLLGAALQGGLQGLDLMSASLLTAGVMAAVAVAGLNAGPASRGRAGTAGYGGGPSPEMVWEDGGWGVERLSYEYDPEGLEEYFSRRPVEVMRRAAQVAAEAAAFGAALAADYASGRVKENEGVRAVQLRGAIERLGPAYVKVAQALSTRVDLLSAAYFDQIQLLQDRVPPFPCEVARAVMQKTFGRRVEDLFTALSDKPVAAASLGQVYRATLRPELGGGEVAVKVQRPGVFRAVALDLLLMRKLAIALKPRLQVDWAAVIDAWAVRFFHEMDYSREADNAAKFAVQMAALKGITVAPVVAELSSDEVLTSRWVAGEKLQESTAPDVRALCTTLLNAYLVQLLETGFLHADPHPGNLLRTPDGRICVLDFGLMTEVSEEQRWALVEFIGHLISENWEAVAVDLKKLGFIPPEIDPLQAGLVDPLGRIMSQLIGGGGAAKVNIDKVVDDLNELSEQYPFNIPPFFALILRAFSVIEGIALGADPDYAIVRECLPYLARRLLADDSPRARALLKDMLYGPGRTRLDIDRLTRLADAFSSFTTDGLIAGNSSGNSGSVMAASASQPASAPASPETAAGGGGVSQQGTPVLALASASAAGNGRSQALSQPQGQGQGVLVDPVVREVLLVVFSRKGTYIQELLVEELAAAVDALSRDAASQVLAAALGSAPALLARGALDALGPLRSVVLPVPTPVEVLARLAPAVAVTAEDREALLVVRGILSLISRAASTAAAASAASQAGTSGGSGASQPGSGSSGSPQGSSGAAAAAWAGLAGGGPVATFANAAAAGGRAGQESVGGSNTDRTAVTAGGNSRGSSPGASAGASSAGGLGLGTLGGMTAAAAAGAGSGVGTAVARLGGTAGAALELSPLLPELLPGLAHTGELLVRALARRASTRLAGSLQALGTPASTVLPPRQSTQSSSPAAASESRNQGNTTSISSSGSGRGSSPGAASSAAAGAATATAGGARGASPSSTSPSTSTAAAAAPASRGLGGYSALATGVRKVSEKGGPVMVQLPMPEAAVVGSQVNSSNSTSRQR